ncbi:MAG: hypothetical protein KatS3mg053_0142 [Candidatus Roseilinea sp.]|nr:MAG: hypothetical protein KatS3mg053_0142 [Candidatus Roseilinea sp.]
MLPVATAKPNDSSEVEITFQISGGIGGIEQSWVIRDDGSVSDKTGKTYAVAPERVARLLNEVTAAGFFELDAAYEDIACADCFAYAITINDGKQSKRVTMLDGGQLPDRAKRVIELLRAFVSALEP